MQSHEGVKASTYECRGGGVGGTVESIAEEEPGPGRTPGEKESKYPTCRCHPDQVSRGLGGRGG